MELDKTYNAKNYENSIYKNWEEKGLFKPEVNPDGKPFTIVLPPPNATGTLHLGHATMLALEDLMIRYHRMQGDAALWLPGTDHAAIATQSKVEGILKKEEGKSRHDLGREAFLDRVKEFVAGSQDTIRNQVRAMGSSVDWDREAYTLDDTRNAAVKKVFTKMYNDGLIYRGHRIVNWDPIGQTTVADDEMDYKEEKTKFYTFKYGPFEIGTARPETKFGDKYVVMHPEDERYADYKHGQEIEIEWINGPMTATVIKDVAAEPEFGTGVMTITPWHSIIDFEIAQRHNLDKEQIIDQHGKLLDIAQEFSGMTIKEAREKIVEKLEAKGLLVSVDEDYKHNIARGDRFKGIIEPQIMEQWFIDVNKDVLSYKGKKHSLKSMLQDMVRSKDVTIIPERFEKGYFGWVDNLRDWCISRQLWWGHRIPVWYKEGSEPFVGEHAPDGEGWEQDPDTLDTWFSSALWTWSTLLDPEKKDLEIKEWFEQSQDRRFHPNQVMETGYDILTFWVIRMMLMTGYVLDEIPFDTVYLHGLVNDKNGQKMSKSKGNGIDPIEMIDKYGADAVRISMVVGTSPGNDNRLYEEKIESARNFINKLWNIARFILMQVENPRLVDEAPKPKTISDKWILSKFEHLVESTKADLDNHRYSAVGENLYEFTWSDLADWYLEDAKVESGKDEILLYILGRLLKLWHPYTPYVTEILYSQLTDAPLITATWPQVDSKLFNQEAEKEYTQYQAMLTAIRNARAEFKIPYSKEIKVNINKGSQEFAEHLKQRAKLSELTFDQASSDEKVMTYHLDGGVEVQLFVDGLIDFAQEVARLQKEVDSLKKFIAGIEKKLKNKKFVDNAPKEVVEEERAKLEEANNKIASIKGQIDSLS
jgi:valyl-tRNA synthetase